MVHSWVESQRCRDQWYQEWSRQHDGECGWLSGGYSERGQGLPPQMEGGPHCWDQSFQGWNLRRRRRRRLKERLVGCY
jgi:hypothetical protein